MYACKFGLPDICTNTHFSPLWSFSSITASVHTHTQPHTGYTVKVQKFAKLQQTGILLSNSFFLPTLSLLPLKLVKTGCFSGFRTALKVGSCVSFSIGPAPVLLLILQAWKKRKRNSSFQLRFAYNNSEILKLYSKKLRSLIWGKIVISNFGQLFVQIQHFQFYLCASLYNIFLSRVVTPSARRET